MALTEEEKAVIQESIESHRRMIKYHRSQILDLSRKLFDEVEHVFESFDLEIKK